MFGRQLAACMAAGALVIAASAPAASQTTAFPAGKTVSLYVATAPGGTADFTMRMVGRYIGKHLPGSPTVVPKNMPGAGSKKLASYLASQAAKDGTEFGLLLRFIATDTLFTPADGTFDVLKLNWLGSPSPVTDVCGFWHTSPVQKFEDLQTKEIVIPGIGADAGEAAQTSILHMLTGAKIKTILGYQSGGEMTLALERGEGHGRCAISWEAVKSTYPDFTAKNQFRPFVQFALARHPELPNIPAIIEFAKTDLDRKALEVFLAPQSFGFPFAAPPDMNPATVAILRQALEATMKDPGFVAEAAQRKFDINFVKGDALEALLKKVYGFPTEVVDRTKVLTLHR